MELSSIQIIYLLIAFVLLKVSFDDITTRTIKHRYLICLMVLILLSWLWRPNLGGLPYSFLIILIGFFLHALKILGAGDTKLLFIISLGVSPDNLFILFFSMTVFSVILILLYLIMALIKGLAYIREVGLPFAVPISFAGMISLLVSNAG